jgi:hypothetical protein
MGGVVRIEINIARHAAGAADPRDDNLSVQGDFAKLQRLDVCFHANPDPTTRAPNVGKAVLAKVGIIGMMLGPDLGRPLQLDGH